MIPQERQARCKDCDAVIDTDKCCRFDNGPHRADTLRCATCCPNCHGGTGNGPTSEEQQ